MTKKELKTKNLAIIFVLLNNLQKFGPAPRAMTFLGGPIEDQKDATPFAPRCMKDQIEEGMFF
ncbi:MAG: hypothetical protein F9K48_02335 [Candidatus Brocadia sp.]|nr:MAG: hypothetical protein F9K48_02335 [Candidatus Brocadia sp.]